MDFLMWLVLGTAALGGMMILILSMYVFLMTCRFVVALTTSDLLWGFPREHRAVPEKRRDILTDRDLLVRASDGRDDRQIRN